MKNLDLAKVMKIMFIETLGDGGIAHYTFNLANSLAGKGAQIILFTNKNYEFTKKEAVFQVEQKMFKVASYLINTFPVLARENGFFTFLRRTIKLLEYPLNTLEAVYTAKKNNIHIVHFQSINEIELLMVIAFKLTAAKIVFTIHNVQPRHGKIRWFHYVLYRFLYLLCNQIIIHSKSGKEQVIKLFSVDPGKISVIPHGDYKFFVPGKMLETSEAKNLLGFSKGCKTILFFGAIRPNKGLDTLLNALPHVKKSIADVRLLIIGELCENYAKYRNIIDRENLTDNIFEKLDYIPQDQVALYFTASDIVVLPYNEITQSGVLQIAYAFAKPVVVTAIGGFKESVESDQNGYLVPPRDSMALAEKITALLMDDNKMRAMGNYSRYLSDTKYTWHSIAEKTYSVYSSI